MNYKQRYEYVLAMLNRLGEIACTGNDVAHGQRLIDRKKARFIRFTTDGDKTRDNLIIAKV